MQVSVKTNEDRVVIYNMYKDGKLYLKNIFKLFITEDTTNHSNLWLDNNIITVNTGTKIYYLGYATPRGYIKRINKLYYKQRGGKKYKDIYK